MGKVDIVVTGSQTSTCDTCHFRFDFARGCLRCQLADLERQEFVERCADDGISPRLRWLWRKIEALKAELTA
jgi:hypothetical protein